MGANNEVDLKGMVDAAEEIYKLGNKMSDRFANVYDDIKKMQTYWQGETYVNFATIANTLTDDFQRISKYFCKTLVEEVYRKRNQYAKASGKKAKDIPSYGWTVFEKVPLKSQGETIKFNDSKMNDLYDKVETRFDNARNDLDKIDDQFDKIKWEGDAGRLVKREFRTRTNDTKRVIKELKTALKDYIRAARDAMNKAETNNSTTSQKVDMSNLGTAGSAAKTGASTLDADSYNWQDHV